MPAALASRVLGPPSKRAKLSQASPPAQNGLKALINGRAPATKSSVAPKTNGATNSRKQRVDDSTAMVMGGHAGHSDPQKHEVIEISSGIEDSDYSSSEGEDGDAAAARVQEEHTNAAHITSGRKADVPIEDGTAEPEELSFGERLQAHAPHAVDVEAAFVGPDSESRALAAVPPLNAPNATSLGTVLTQALRTNDQDLLDTCLRVIDVDTIYATVERLPSPLVGNLLQKLAGRLHKKPGRAGMLMVWIQWSLAAHGGYLASQPQLVNQLATLNRVLKERASGLQPLLSLKGRLDMIHAQLELRRRNQRRAANDDEEAVIYVEGEDDQSSADEDGLDPMTDHAKKRIRQDSEEGEDSIDEMPTTMEVNEESDEGSEDSEGLFDEEAEETGNDTGGDLSDPMSDDGLEGDGGSESEEETKPARRSTIGRAGLARRY